MQLGLELVIIISVGCRYPSPLALAFHQKLYRLERENGVSSCVGPFFFCLGLVYLFPLEMGIVFFISNRVGHWRMYFPSTAYPSARAQDAGEKNCCALCNSIFVFVFYIKKKGASLLRIAGKWEDDNIPHFLSLRPSLGSWTNVSFSHQFLFFFGTKMRRVRHVRRSYHRLTDFAILSRDILENWNVAHMFLFVWFVCSFLIGKMSYTQCELNYFRAREIQYEGVSPFFW